MRWIPCFFAVRCPGMQRVPSLPTLPQANDDTPGSLTWVSLTAAVGGAVVDPSSWSPGRRCAWCSRCAVSPTCPWLAWRRCFRCRPTTSPIWCAFHEGDRCLSDAQGQCAVVLVSRGGAGAFRLSGARRRRPAGGRELPLYGGGGAGLGARDLGHRDPRQSWSGRRSGRPARSRRPSAVFRRGSTGWSSAACCSMALIIR